MKKITRNTVYQIINVILLLLLVIWTIPVFFQNIIRFGLSIWMFLQNIWIYLKFVFTGDATEDIITSINLVGSDLSVLEVILPIDPYIFLKHITVTFTMPFNGIIAEYWLYNWFEFLLLAFRVVLMVLMLYFALKLLFTNYYQEQEFDAALIGKETKPKIIFNKIVNFLKIPYEYIKDYILFNKEKTYYFKLAIFLILFRTAFISVAIETLGFLFAFVVKIFDGGLPSLWIQICCIIIDLFPYIKWVPLPIWIIVIYTLFAKHWIENADDEIRHQHLILKGIVRNEMTTTNFIVGPPSSGKDLICTQCTIIAESNLRYDLKEMMMKIRSEYPEFDFVSFEKEIQKLIDKKKVVNWAQAEAFVSNVCYKSYKRKKLLYGYDWMANKAVHYNELKPQYIFEALPEYAHLFFMYAQDSALAASNYPIRFDNIKYDNGHFIIWDDDFITHDNNMMYEFSQYSHINNYDWQRIYKKTIDDENSQLEDGCILVFSEYAKERLNKNELKEQKIKVEQANQVNDGTNVWWKTKTHENVVRNKRFGQSFINDQRDQSLNADNRETFEYTWTIIEKTEPTLVLSGFWYSRILLDWISGWANNHFELLSSTRSNNSLWFYIVKKINAFCVGLNERIFNRWGMHYSVLKNQYEKQLKMPMIYKLIYADRYNTGMFTSYYVDLLLQNNKGFKDSPTWTSTKASVEELLSTRSYFMKNLYTKKEKKQEDVEIINNNFGF